MLTLTESGQVVKTVKPTLAWSWGYEDGKAGESEYKGYDYFLGPQLAEYRQGFSAGRIMAGRLSNETPAIEQPAYVPAQHRMIFYAGGRPPELDVDVYVPFSDPALAQVQPAEMREDYVGM